MLNQSQLKLIEEAKQALFELDKRRECLPGFEKKELSKSTIQTYKTTYNHLSKTAATKKLGLIKYAKQTKCPSTWFKRKAAIIYHFKTELKNDLEKVINLNQSQPPEELFQFIALHTKGLIQGYSASLNLKEGEKSKKKSKKSQISKLKFEGDWRLEILRRMPKYRHQILTLILTGCRPAELEEGVDWCVIGDTLKATITGVKLGVDADKKEREITFDKSSPASKELFELVESSGGEIKIKTENAGKLTFAIRSAGKRAFPKFKHSVTSYCFRHQLSADLKSGEVNGNNISKLLGHRSARTKGYYGTRQSGRRGAIGHILEVSSNIDVDPLNDNIVKFFNDNNFKHPYIKETKSPKQNLD